MRIQNHMKPALDHLKKETMGNKMSNNFSAMMVQSQQKLHEEALQKLRQQVEAKGTQLLKSQTLANMLEYKKVVKQFLEEAVQHGLEMQNREGFNSRGRSQMYKIVEEVDKKLLELTNEIVHKEENGLEVLSLVGEIKGLLVNLYY